MIKGEKTVTIELDFKGRVAVITGAGSGMGLLTAQKFAESGAHAVMLDINEEVINAEAKKLTDAGYSALPIKCDVREYSEIENALKTAHDKFGRIDYTISFAGGCPERILGEKDENGGREMMLDKVRVSTYDWGIDVNFRAPIYMAKAAFGYMKEQKSGVIINISSIDGVTGSYSITYSASKSGLFGLTKSVAKQGAPYGIRCCCVIPGPVITRPDMAGMPTLLGYAAEPIEIVEPVMYLCSDHARSITGSKILVDGGRACMI